MAKKIYVASPLGFSEAGRYFMYQKLIPLIEEAGYEVLDPWKLTPENNFNQILSMPVSPEKTAALKKLNFKIGENNAKSLKLCDGVVAILDGADVDSGTAGEIGFAYALQKPILGYRGDIRLSSDNMGSIVNLQVEYFIIASGGKIITNLANLKDEMKKLFG